MVARLGLVLLLAMTTPALPARGEEPTAGQATARPCPERRTPDDYRPDPPPRGINPGSRVDQIRRAARRNAVPDSTKYRLAMELWRVGTVEGRQQALLTLDDVRATYDHLPEYHWRRALIFEERELLANARAELGEVLHLDPDDVEAQVEIARLQLREVLFLFDLSLSRGFLASVHRALALCPDHREALLLDAVAGETIGGLQALAHPDWLKEGLAAADRILGNNPADYEARLLRAILLIDLGRIEDGSREFDRAFEEAPDDLRQAFSSLEWTAMPAAVEESKKMDVEVRGRFDQAYWRFVDPTPLTLTNEYQLIIWKRLVLADRFFGRPAEGIRGWNSPPGRVFVRYGAPRMNDFDPGKVTAYPGVDIPPPPGLLGAIGGPILYIPPSWQWHYHFRQLHFGVRFEDAALSGNFVLDSGSAALVATLQEVVPVIFEEAPPGQIGAITIAAAGVAGEGHNIREAVEVGVPLWRPLAKGDWIREVRIEIAVRDSSRRTIARVERHFSADDLARYFGGTLDLLVSREEFNLMPGHYTVAAFITDDDKKEEGLATIPLDIGTYAGATDFRMSDIHLALGLEPGVASPRISRLGEEFRPDPLAFAEDDRQLDVYYELYGVAREGSTSRHRARYTILPRYYLLEYERLAREGSVRADDIVAFAEEQLRAGGSDLTPENYLDVFFPTATLRLERNWTPKGARIPIPDLVPGEYALITTVTDQVSGESTSNRTFFRILDDDQRRKLVSYAAKH